MTLDELASAAYHPRLPLFALLPYTELRLGATDTQGWARVAWVCAAVNRYVAPRSAR